MMDSFMTRSGAILIVTTVGFVLCAGPRGTGADPPRAAAPAPQPKAQRPNGPFVQLGLIPGRGRGGEQARLPQVFVPLRRDLKRSLSRARTALKERRYADAVTQLDALLNGPEVEDYFIDSPPGSEAGTRTSLKATVRRLLGSLPEKGREVYELQFGAAARRLLTEAIDSGEVEKLMEVSRKYFHTTAGYEATLLAGHYLLSGGRPLAAAILLQRFDEAPGAAKELDPELSLLRAICWRLVGNAHAAQEMILSLARRFPNASVTVRGQPTRIVDVSSSDDQDAATDQSLALTWLDELIGSSHDTYRSGTPEWLLYRGDSTRNASSRGGVPLLRWRWRVPTANDWSDEQQIRTLAKQFVDRGLPAMPDLQPLAVGDVVLMRSPHELLAVDFKTGKRIWLYPWDTDLAGWASDGGLAPPSFSRSWSQATAQAGRRQFELRQRIWDDCAYGQISSDGSSLFLLDELDFASSPTARVQRLVPGAFGGFQAASGESNNRLVALDLRTQGKLLWAVGRARDGYPGDEPRLADAFFLGPPLPLSGQLYVLAEINGEVRLVVLDAGTGSLSWSQQLAHFESPQQTVGYNRLRRLAGASPSFADGVLVCPVSAGAVVGVDLATRSLRWGYQYRLATGNRRRSLGPWNPGLFAGLQDRDPGDRWTDATATIAEGRVLLTPVESDQLHCLDLVTGKLVWPPHDRGEDLLVACVLDGKAVLVGKHQVRAIRLADGKPAWKEPLKLPAEAMPSGRGFLSGHQYFLPTTAPDLLRINVPDGTYKTTHLDFPLGNLICHQGEIISQSARWLETFYQVDHLRELVERRLARSPDDPWALEHQALVLINEGRPAAALRPLRRALQLYPDDAPRRDAAQTLLVDTLLDALRQDFVANRELAREVDRLIDQPRQRDEYLRLMAQGLEKSGQYGRAFDTYLEIAQSHALQPRPERTDFLEDNMIALGRDRQVRRDRWLQGIVHRLLGKASGPERQQMQRRIQTLAREALAADTSGQLRGFLAMFGGQPEAHSVRLRLAEHLVDSDQLLEAELTLRPLTESTSPPVAAPAVALTARLLERAERFEESAAWYQRLAQQYPDVVCGDGKTGRQVFQALPESGHVIRALDSEHAWPDGQVVLQRGRPSAADQTNNGPFGRFRSRQTPIEIRQSDSILPAGTRLVLSSQLDSIGMLDRTGRMTQYVSLDRSSRGPSSLTRSNRATHAKLYGHLMLVSLGNEIVAIDSLSLDAVGGMEVLWHENLGASVSRVSSSRRPLAAKSTLTPWGANQFHAIGPDGKPTGIIGSITDRGICYQVGRELRCVDPYTNQLLWVRSLIAPSSDLFGDDRLVFVVSPGTTMARVFSRLDGKELDQRPVPPAMQRWSTLGRRVLVWDRSTDPDHPVQVRLLDPWTNRDLWSHRFAQGSKGQLIEGDAVGIMQPDGKFALIRLHDGAKQIDIQLQPETSLSNIYMLPNGDQLLLVANRRFSATGRVTMGTSLLFTRPVNGRVYALDRRRGEPRWSAPAVIENCVMPTGQPPGIPVLTFLRNETSMVNGRSRRKVTVICMDRRDGRALLEAKENVSTVSTFEVTANPDKDQVTVRLNSTTSYRFQFTNQPRAPEPPVQTGHASSAAGANIGGRLVEVAGAILNAIGRQTPQVPPLDASRVQENIQPMPAKPPAAGKDQQKAQDKK